MTLEEMKAEVRRILGAVNGPMAGGMLAQHLLTLDANRDVWPPGKPFGLWARESLSDVVQVVGRAGMDSTYALIGSERAERPIGSGPEARSGRSIWAVFSNPSSIDSVVIDDEGNLAIARSGDVSQRVKVDSISKEEYSSAISDFLKTRGLGSQVIEGLRLSEVGYWERFRAFLESGQESGLNEAWLQFRYAFVVSVFFDRIAALDMRSSSRVVALADLLVSQQEAYRSRLATKRLSAAPARLTALPASSSPELAKSGPRQEAALEGNAVSTGTAQNIAARVIRRMQDSDVRLIRVPLGAVIDEFRVTET